MSYIFTTTLYPNDKAAEVAKRYLEAIAKYPPDASLGTSIVPVAVKSTLQGIETITIIDVKKGKFEDSMLRVSNVLAMFNDIQGYRSSTQVYMNLEEALKTTGM